MEGISSVDACAARDAGVLLTLWLEYAGEPADFSGDLIVQARGLGCRSVFLVNKEGGPVMSRRLDELVSAIETLGMSPGIGPAGQCPGQNGRERVPSGCLFYLCGMYFTSEGDARPCPGTALECHPDFRKGEAYPLNARRKPLKEIYHSGLFYYCRHIDSFLEGKCKGCVFLGQCVGCRGSAFTAGIAGGMGPLQALASECPKCRK